MSIEIRDERIEVRDKRRLMVQLEPESLEVLGSPHHLAMYFALARLAGNEHQTAPGLRALAAQACMGHTKAAQVLNDLIECGIVSRTRVKLDNGQDSASIYHLHGLGSPPAVDGVRDTDTAIRDTDTSIRQAGSVRDTDTRICRQVRDTDTAIRGADTMLLLQFPEEQQQGVASMVAAGVTPTIANELMARDPDECLRQLDYLADRQGLRDPAAALVKAIRERWSPPSSPIPAQQFALPMPGLEDAVCATCDGTGFVDSDTPGTMRSCPACRS